MVGTAIVVGAGAAIGAATSAISGGNPLEGALLGGVGGGVGAALGGASAAVGALGLDDASGVAATGLSSTFGSDISGGLSDIGGALGGPLDLSTAALNPVGTPLLGSTSLGSSFANQLVGQAVSSLGPTPGSSNIGNSAQLPSGTNGSNVSGANNSSFLSSILPSGNSFLSPALLSGATNALGSYFAAANQEAAAGNATAAQLNMFGQEQTNLLPFIQSGQGANSALSLATGLNTNNPLASPLLQAPTSNWSEAQLTATPGYQFNLAQGLESVQNAAAARGLGVSGAALKGAESYATGLADSTYQNQFNNAVTNQTNQFNRLMALSQVGQNSAVNLGAQGVQTGANIGSNIIGAANAGSAAITSGANAVGNSLLLPSYLSAISNTSANGG